MMNIFIKIILILLLIYCNKSQYCDSGPDAKKSFEVEKNIMVPMRDKIRLATDLYFPLLEKEKLPSILIRTPYGKENSSVSDAEYFAEAGFVVVVQDVRGKHRSEGEFTILKNEGPDGYDMVSWIVEQPWSNGKVGTYGCSYLGEGQLFLAKLRHPNHITMIAQSAGGGLGAACGNYSYFEFFDGGTLSLDGALSWIMSFGVRNFKKGEGNCTYSEMLWSLPIIDIVTNCGAETDWEALLSHSLNDNWWSELGYFGDSDSIDLPALHINSWFDYGIKETFCEYELFKENATNRIARDNQFLIIAPSKHCKFEETTDNTLVGDLEIGNAKYPYKELYVKWFDYWLKDLENDVLEMPKIQMYLMGKNLWKEADAWPLPNTEYIPYYLHSTGKANENLSDGRLSLQIPAHEKTDTIIYNPGDPAGSYDLAQRIAGNNRISSRKDVLVYTSNKLENGIEITGPIKVVLYASSNVKDTDFTARIFDVDPDGSMIGISKGIIRARFRDSFNSEKLMLPGKIYKIEIKLRPTSIFLRKDHSIRLEISSSDFPYYDRNLNTGNNNFAETCWEIAENRIFHSYQYPSQLLLPIIE